jgi:membrane-bound ClpP family serine protease
MMKGRLILAIVSTLAEEALLVAAYIWGLPALGLEWPPVVLYVLMALLALNAVFFYRIGSRALLRKPVTGLGSAVGHNGRVVSRLQPEGVVRIGDELWEAVLPGGQAEVGEEISVIEQDGLRLIVKHREKASGGS